MGSPSFDLDQAHRPLPEEVDVVVIGGGIVGAASALFLAERGLSVALCEKGHIAGEQSSRNWGWVRQMGRDPAELPLSILSLSLWSGLNERVGVETGFRRTGIVYLCAKQRELAEQEAWLEHARAYQLRSRLLAGHELAALVPGAAGDFVGGLYTASDGRAEPGLATSAIAAAASRGGARILENCAVRTIDRQAGRVSAAITERGPIRCRAVVLAGGAWSRLFAGNLGIDFPQLKVLGSAGRVEGVVGAPDLPVGGGDFAFRRRLDGGYTIARRNANVAPVVPDSFRLFREFAPALVKQWRELSLSLDRRFLEEWRTPRSWEADEVSPFEHARILDPQANEGHIRQGLANLARAFPAFATARLTQSWGGLIDVTPDAVPVIGPVEAVPGLFIASGFSGHGFGIGPGAGLLVADLVTGDSPCVDPRPFRLERLRPTSARPASPAAVAASAR